METAQKIEVAKQYKKLYFILRLALYAALIIAIVVFLIKLIYPNEKFYFLFRVYKGAGNTIDNPRNSHNVPIDNGEVDQNNEMLFNASVLGFFSDAKISLKLLPNSASIENGTVSVTKSYQAFLYPQDAPIGWRDGSLIKTEATII